jgi:hypothetical protein
MLYKTIAFVVCARKNKRMNKKEEKGNVFIFYCITIVVFELIGHPAQPDFGQAVQVVVTESLLQVVHVVFSRG